MNRQVLNYFGKRSPRLAALLGGVSGSREKTSQTSDKPGGKTLYVGDSLGVGTTQFLKGVMADAVTSRKSAEGAKIVKRKAKGAGAIVFDLGTNDGSAKELQKSLNATLRAARGKPVYALSIQGGRDVAAKNRVLKRSGATVIDTSNLPHAGDGVHYNPSEYKKRARMVQSAIKDLNL